MLASKESQENSSLTIFLVALDVIVGIVSSWEPPNGSVAFLNAEKYVSFSEA